MAALFETEAFGSLPRRTWPVMPGTGDGEALPPARVLRFGHGLYEVIPIPVGVNKFQLPQFSLVRTAYGDHAPAGSGLQLDATIPEPAMSLYWAQTQEPQDEARNSPAPNERLIREEMKELALALLARQHPGPAGAREACSRLFEQACEWQEMTYLFYPSCWARRSSWARRVLSADDDPQFEAFLKAGAARVMVPVRPGFEHAVARFIEAINA